MGARAHLNLAAISYRTGYFQDALTHWRTSWELGRSGTDVVSTDLANLALAEYAKMNAPSDERKRSRRCCGRRSTAI